jgi:hypothetical protein
MSAHLRAQWRTAAHLEVTRLYHVSPTKNRYSILRQGLNSGPRYGYTWGFTDLDLAISKARSKGFSMWGACDVWEIDTRGLRVVPDPHPGWQEEYEGWWIDDHSFAIPKIVIPPSRLKRIDYRQVDDEEWKKEVEQILAEERKTASSSVMYHQSSPKNRESIEREGLLTHRSEGYSFAESNGYPAGVYLIADRDMATRTASGMDVYEVDVSGLDVLPDSPLQEHSYPSWYVPHAIDASRVKLIHEAGS